MSDQDYIEFYDDEEDPNQLPEDLKAIWLWLCEQSEKATETAAETYDRSFETSQEWLRHAMSIATLRQAVFDTDRARKDEASRLAVEKLDLWKALTSKL